MDVHHIWPTTTARGGRRHGEGGPQSVRCLSVDGQDMDGCGSSGALWGKGVAGMPARGSLGPALDGPPNAPAPPPTGVNAAEDADSFLREEGLHV